MSGSMTYWLRFLSYFDHAFIVDAVIAWLKSRPMVNVNALTTETTIANFLLLLLLLLVYECFILKIENLTLRVSTLNTVFVRWNCSVSFLINGNISINASLITCNLKAKGWQEYVSAVKRLQCLLPYPEPRILKSSNNVNQKHNVNFRTYNFATKLAA